MSATEIHSRWNQERGEVSHRVSKIGTSVYMVLSDAELMALQDQITWALGSQHVRTG